MAKARARKAEVVDKDAPKAKVARAQKCKSDICLSENLRKKHAKIKQIFPFQFSWKFQPP